MTEQRFVELVLVPFHTRIINEMETVHGTLRGGTAKALRAAHEIGSTAIPKNHIADVRDSLTSMLDKLDYNQPGSRRFNMHGKSVINRAYRALEHQEKSDETAGSENSAGNGVVDPHMKAADRHAELGAPPRQ